MSGKIILNAFLPVATSVNAMHDSKNRLTPAARAYRAYCTTILTDYKNSRYKSQYSPFYVFYQDDEAIAVARALKETKSKAKAVRAMHKKYCMEVLVVYGSELRDLDNQYKLMQDTVADFLCFNDRRVIKIVQLKEVDATVPPHVELTVRLEDSQWPSGWLMEQAKLELQAAKFYEDYNYEQFLKEDGGLDWSDL